ncbi:MAG: DUF481 domain-containing protein [Cocleimonas sp.]|nr:DUF481 domain-containing protein [Cocleimonas sp.]MCK5896230.1 DUF481 domain-containing protein [Cocleimonas sp.]
MKKYNLLATAIAFSASFAAPSMAEPSLFDYQEATSSYEDAYVAGNFDIGSGNQDQSSYDLDLFLDYEKVFSSPDRNTKFDFSGSGSRSRGPKDGDETKSTFQLLGSATVDNYFQPGSKGAFWYGKGEVGAKKDQKKAFSKATIGVGYGRVVNVTPMARAIRVIQALRQKGTLQSDPVNSTYQAVAEIIAKEDQYRSRHGAKNYNQYWIGDIEKALNATLGAQGVIKSYDVLTQESISTRKHGWLVRAGVGAVLSDYDGETSKPAVEVGAEYHLPLSNQTQLSNEAIFTTTLKDDSKSYIFNNELSLTHELTDVIDWENKWLLSYNKFDEADSTTANTLTSAFNYELTNQLDFNITAKLAKTTSQDDIDKRLTMGIQYRLK